MLRFKIRINENFTKSKLILVILIFFFTFIFFFIKENNFSSIKNTPNLSIKKNNNFEDVLKKINLNKIDGTLIISISNFGFKKFSLNWIKSVINCGYKKFLVFCFDKELLEYLKDQGFSDNSVLIPRTWLDYNVEEKYSNWKSIQYNQITQSKVNIWKNLIKLNQTILYSDPDVVFLNKNILTHIEYNMKYSYSEIMFAQDQEIGSLYYNTGFFFAKPTKFVENLFLDLIKEQQKDPVNSIDQLVLHKMLQKFKYSDTRLNHLDPILFASGKVFFQDNMNDKFHFRPYIVHANYMKGKEAKIKALRSRGFWIR